MEVGDYWCVGEERMLYLILKAGISGILIAIASTLAKRYPGSAR